MALHGRIADVVCLGCRATSPRAALQERLTALNPGFAERHAEVEVRPDGDVELDDTAELRGAGLLGVRRRCSSRTWCSSARTSPPPRVARCYAAVDALAERGGALLVAGSSLTVMSGFRFVRRAAKAEIPVVVVNRGETRGDELATYKVDVGCSEFLAQLAEQVAERVQARGRARAGRGRLDALEREVLGQAAPT